MNSRAKQLLVFVVKALVAVVLIGWLVRGGNLDLGALALLVERPWLLAMDLGLFGLGAVIGTFRFRVLLGIAEVDVPIRTLFRLQMVAFFFNVVIPGNIGGDVVKALYVARDAPASKRTTILLLTFVERLLGVVSLILMGGVIVLLRGRTILSDPLLRPLASTVLALGAATVAFGGLALVLVRRAGGWLERFTTGPSKLSKLLARLVASMRIVADGPSKILLALILSMTFHAAGMGFFTVVTETVLRQNIPYSAVAAVFPLGLLSLMLPISPAGLGVGHVAFKRLFEAIGLSGGASVFNVYLLGQMAPCLLGVFPFLALRRRGELPAEAENRQVT